MGIGADIRAALFDAVEPGLLKAAQQVKARSDANIPVGDPGLDPDPGTAIKESGYIEVHGRVVEVGYRAPYSAKQHEDQHLKHPRGGSAKFLENALKAEAPRLEGLMAGEVRKNMKPGSRRARSRRR